MYDIKCLIEDELVEYENLLWVAKHVEGDALIELSRQMAGIHNLAAQKIAEKKNISHQDARDLFSVALRTGWGFSLSLPGLDCPPVVTDDGKMFLGETVCAFGGCGNFEPAPSLSEQELSSYLEKDYPFLAGISAFLEAEGIKGEINAWQTGSYHEVFVKVGYLLDWASTARLLEKYANWR